MDREHLYEQLEGWVADLARLVAIRTGLSRWLDDLQQDARVALWQAIQEFDSGRHDDIERFCKWRVQCRLKNAIRQYRRWDDRELTMLNDLLDE